MPPGLYGRAAPGSMGLTFIAGDLLVYLSRYYEFAENGLKPQDVSAGRTHGSAPTANDVDGLE